MLNITKWFEFQGAGNEIFPLCCNMRILQELHSAA